ncbi:MAG: hypothetical protein AB7K09_14150 [Planctomycetota bacterium]
MRLAATILVCLPLLGLPVVLGAVPRALVVRQLGVLARPGRPTPWRLTARLVLGDYWRTVGTLVWSILAVVLLLGGIAAFPMVLVLGVVHQQPLTPMAVLVIPPAAFAAAAGVVVSGYWPIMLLANEDSGRPIGLAGLPKMLPFEGAWKLTKLTLLSLMPWIFALALPGLVAATTTSRVALIGISFVAAGFVLVAMASAVYLALADVHARWPELRARRPGQVALGNPVSPDEPSTVLRPTPFPPRPTRLRRFVLWFVIPPVLFGVGSWLAICLTWLQAPAIDNGWYEREAARLAALDPREDKRAGMPADDSLVDWINRCADDVQRSDRTMDRRKEDRSRVRWICERISDRCLSNWSTTHPDPLTMDELVELDTALERLSGAFVPFIDIVIEAHIAHWRRTSRDISWSPVGTLAGGSSESLAHVLELRAIAYTPVWLDELRAWSALPAREFEAALPAVRARLSALTAGRSGPWPVSPWSAFGETRRDRIEERRIWLVRVSLRVIAASRYAMVMPYSLADVPVATPEMLRLPGRPDMDLADPFTGEPIGLVRNGPRLTLNAPGGVECETREW